MIFAIWKNPEFVRHARASVRRTRAIAIAATVLAICALVWLGIWGSEHAELDAMRNVEFRKATADQILAKENSLLRDVWRDFYQFVIGAQLAVLTFWSMLACALSISGERERKTWDFQRATRLSPGELLAGKLVGEPVVAYYIVLCCLPLTAVAGLWGGEGWKNLGTFYALMLSGSLFIGLTGLWLSNLFEARSRGVGLIGTFGIYLMFAFATQMSQGTMFPGLAGFSPLAGILPQLGSQTVDGNPTIFGARVSWLLLSLLLYATFSAWLVLALVRTLKKDYDQMKPLSRWEVVGCSAFVSFTMYALFLPRQWENLNATRFAELMVGMNGFVLFLMGMAMLTSAERLKVWWRSRSGVGWLLAEDGLAWPWLVISAAAGYLLLLWGMFAWKEVVGFEGKALALGLLLFVVVAVYVVRDVTFLQWCRLTQMRSPVVKGFLYVGLYYAAAGVATAVVNVASRTRGEAVLAWLTPFQSFAGDISGKSLLQIGIGLAIQMALTGWLVMAIGRRVRRT